MKAFAVGVCASAPLGPVAIWVFQKSLSKGAYPAFIGGLGAAVIDTLYAAISLFALSFIQDFLARHEAAINVVGGIIIVIIGVKIFFKKPETLIKSNGTFRRSKASFSDFATTLGMALANPGALALMLAMIALFGLDINSSPAPGAFLLSMVFLGAASFWLLFSFGTALCRKIINQNHMLWVNRVTGFLVVVFGVCISVRGIILADLPSIVANL